MAIQESSTSGRPRRARRRDVARARAAVVAGLVVLLLVAVPLYVPARCVTSSCSLRQDLFLFSVKSRATPSGAARGPRAGGSGEDDPLALVAAEDDDDDDDEDKEEDVESSEKPEFSPEVGVRGEQRDETDNGKPRVVLFTGLRWTGQEVLRELATLACSKRKCRPLCAVANPKFLFTLNVDEYNAGRDKALAELKSVAADAAAGETLYFASLFGNACEHGHDSMTFPPAERAFHSRDHPDLLDLHRLAEEAGVDLRIVVPLPRSVHSLGSAWLEHPPPGAVSTLRILQTQEVQLHALYGQLLQLPHGSFRLLDTEGLESPGGALDNWVGIPGAMDFVRSKKDALAQGTNKKPNEAAAAFLDDVEIVLDMVWGLASADGGVEAADEERPVPKTVYSTPGAPRPRMVFWAGLEGTGHHLWREVMTALIVHKELVAECKVQALLYSNDNRRNLWHSAELKEYYFAKQELAKQLGVIGTGAGNAGKIFLANLLNRKEHVCSTKAGMMSYPNFSGNGKNIQRPNLIALARLAEAAGVDLQIVVLLRSAEAIVASTVDHRHFAAEGNEVRILESNAHGLLAQLKALDPRFVAECVEFEDTEHQYLPRLAETFNSNNLSQLYFKIANVNGTFSKAPPPTRRARFVQSLHDTSTAVKNQCPPRR